MVPLLGLFLLLPVSLAARVHGLAQSRSIQKRPSVDVRNQQQHDGQLLRLPMSRRPPKITKKTPIAARNLKAGSFAHLRASKTHHTSTRTSSAKATATPIAANTTSFFQDAAYGIDLWIGNYPQRVTLDFDTGSSETWVSPPCTGWEMYPDYEALCRLLGTYIPEQSSSVVDNKDTCPPSWIMYGSGDVYIAYYQDDIRFNDPYKAAEQFEPEMGPVAEKVRFGMALDAENMPSGIFGAAYGAGYNQDYNSVIDDMHEQGLIATKDFSVALGSVGAENGEVVFGGIDIAKFTGELHEIEISHQLPKMMDGYYRYWINVTSIGVTKPGSCETVPVTPKGFDERFLPDTGTSLTYMPSEAFDKILEAFPDAELSDEGFGYTVDCSHRSSDGTIDYTFPDGFTVRVPFSEFIFLVPGDAVTGFKDVCLIGAVPTEALFILGDTFLRAVYAVFSQEHHKVYLAQYQDCGTHVVPSKGKKNGGLQGLCAGAGHGVGDTQGRHYGYPTSTSAEAGVCTSYSTASHPKWSTTSTDDTFGTELFPNAGRFRPMIQTGGGRVANVARPTSAVRSAPGPPWGSNVTSASQGTAGSTGFLPVPTGASSSGNFTTVSFEPVTLSNTTVPGTTATVSQFSFESWSSSSTRADVPTSSSKTSSHGMPTLTLTPFPTALSSSSCTSASSDLETESDTAWWTLTSSSSYEWDTSSSSESSASPVVTIPVQPHETIVVKLQSTTYTIVDGTTLSGEASASSSYDISSWYSSQTKHKHHTTSESWGGTSFSWETLSFTTFSDETSSTTSTKKKHTTTSSSSSSTTTTTHKKTKTTAESTSSWVWETYTSELSSSSSIDAQAGGYLTSWAWNPTASSEVDPFYTSSSSSTSYEDDNVASSSWGWESSVTSDSVPAWSPSPTLDVSMSLSSSSSSSWPWDWTSWSESSSSSTSSASESLSSVSSWSLSWSGPSASPSQSSSWSFDWGTSSSSTSASESSLSSSSSWSWGWGSSTSSGSGSESSSISSSSWDWGSGSSSAESTTTTTHHRHTTTTSSPSFSVSASVSSSSETFPSASRDSSSFLSFAISEAPSLTTTVVKQVTATITKTWGQDANAYGDANANIEKRQTDQDSEPAWSPTSIDKPTDTVWESDDWSTISEITITPATDTPLSFAVPSSSSVTTVVVSAVETVWQTETIPRRGFNDNDNMNKDFYIPPSSLHIMPWQADAAVPAPNPTDEQVQKEKNLKPGLEKRVVGNPGDRASGYDSGYESGFEVVAHAAASSSDGECDFLASPSRDATDSSKGQTASGEGITPKGWQPGDCLRAMQAHRNKGRSVAFCRGYLAGIINNNNNNNNNNLKIPRYLQSGCVVANLNLQEKDDGRLISQACKCLMSSSPGSGASSSDHMQDQVDDADENSSSTTWGKFVQGVLRRG